MRIAFLLVFSFLITTANGEESWLSLPSEPVQTQSRMVEVEEGPSNKQLIQWMSTASQHGIEISQKNWLQLAFDPSSQNVKVVANQFASSLDVGQFDRSVYQPGWKIKDQPALPVIQAHMDANTFGLIEPKIPEYVHLKRALVRLSGWLDAASKELPETLQFEEGDRNPAINRLNRWLYDLDLADNLSGQRYSKGHLAVIKKLQGKYGLRRDGVFGLNTRRALVALTVERIKLIKLNMERVRWLPRTLPYPHVMVDIAGFKVVWAANDKKRVSYRAIVGKPSRQTPVFQEEIESISVNPYWRVPSSIASTSLLRNAKKDSGFLKREGFRVYSSWKAGAREVDSASIDWTQYSRRNFPYRIEQKPGRVNRLGQFKLDSPNAYSIYLHDTDKPQLFQKEQRTFSSGCTRVDNIEGLIGNILSSQKMGYRLHSIKSSKKTEKVVLKKRIPLYFVYFTAWPDSNGRVRFRKDVYNLDVALLASL